MRTLLLALVLAGCSDLVKVAEPKTVLVTWERVKPTRCPEVGNFDGCATREYDYSICKIQMAEDAPDYIVAEEFKHCFGWSHKWQSR